MNTKKFFIVLSAFAGLWLAGCSDEPLSPVAPTDQASLQKHFTWNFTAKHIPTGVTNPGIFKYPDGKIMLLKFNGPTLFTRLTGDGPDVLSGPGEIEINGITDLTTMTGQWQGKIAITPAGVPDRLWQITYHGPSIFSPTAWNGGPGWILTLQMTGHGEGGDINGMQFRAEALVYVELNFAAWYADFTGVITSH